MFALFYKPFLLSSLYAFIDRVVLALISENERHRRIIDAESTDGPEEDDTKCVRNKYMGSSYSIRGILLILSAQVSLMAYVVFFVNADTARHGIQHVSSWIAIIITLTVDK